MIPPDKEACTVLYWEVIWCFFRYILLRSPGETYRCRASSPMQYFDVYLRSSTCCLLLKDCWPSSYRTSRRGFAQPLPRSSTRRGMPGWSRCAHTFGTVIEAIQSYYVHVGSSYWTTVIITHSDMDDLWRFPQRLLDAKAKKRCKAPKLPVETIEPSVVQPEPAVNVDDVTVSWRHWPLAWISPPQPHPLWRCNNALAIFLFI